MIEYAYYIGGTRVYPQDIQDLALNWTKEEGDIFFRKKLSKELTFITDSVESIDDANTLLNILSSEDYTDKLFYIFKGATEVFRGIFKIFDISVETDGNYYLKITLQPEPNDKVQPIKQYLDVEVNVLDIFPKSTVTTYYLSTINFTAIISISDLGLDPVGLVDGDGWELFFKGTKTDEGLTYYYYFYAREEIVTDKSTSLASDGYTKDSLLSTENVFYWVRNYSDNFPTATTADYQLNLSSATPTGFRYYFKIILGFDYYFFVKNSTYPIRNYFLTKENDTALQLKETIEYIIDNNGSNFTGQVKSSFLFNDAFESDYDSTFDLTTNKNYYTGVDNKLNNIYLIELSDFKKPDATEAATIGLLKLKDIIEFLWKRFQVKWHIDRDGNFRLEHISYYDNEIGLDLTSDELNSELIEGKKSYSFETSELANRERFEDEEYTNDDWQPIDILYDNVNLVNGEKENLIEYIPQRIYTNIDYYNRNVQDSINDGFVMIITDDSNVVDFETGRITDLSVQNGHLALKNLIYTYWLYDRSAPTVTIKEVISKGEETATVNKTKRIKKQEPIEIVTSDFLDTTKLIKANINVNAFNQPIDAGRVVTCKEFLQDGRKEIELIY